MVLNYIWLAFFLIAFVIAVVKLLFFGDTEVFPNIMASTFDTAKTAFEISLGLTGVLSLWMGIMRIGEKGGVVAILARWLGPLFKRLFPEIPEGHPVVGNIFMNLSANMLGLDNAATPLGLKAMEGLQELNPNKERATNAMIMFLVLNTSDVFIPILLATFFSTLSGIIVTALFQRINLLNRTLLLTLGGASVVVAGIIYGMASLNEKMMNLVGTTAANVILFSIIIAFLLAGMRRRINVYETFVEGAKSGFDTAVRIIPYLVAMLVAIGVFRASGAMDALIGGVQWCVAQCGLDAQWVGALPTALMKPLSGSGARGMMVDAMQTQGADSFVGRLSCIFQGSTDTTFYILAVYFGSVGVRHTRHAVAAGLLADLAGIIAAIAICYLFFG